MKSPITPLRIVHQVQSVEAESSGATVLVRGLTEALTRQRVEASLVACGSRPTGWPAAVPLHLSPEWPRGSGFSLAADLKLKTVLSTAELLHIHGIWLPSNIMAAMSARRLRRPIVWSVHGMLTEWAMRNSRWKKAIVWHLAQRRVLTWATCFHVMSANEAQDFQRLGLKQPVAIVPSGIDIPNSSATHEPGRRRQLIFVSRLHPVKGLRDLLGAWQVLAVEFPEWDLYIVGPDEAGHRSELENLATDLTLGRVTFAGEQVGVEKERSLLNSDLFVLPSFSENFGFVVAEALATGIPVVTTRETPWQELKSHACGWCIETGPAALIAALRDAMSRTPAERHEMGQRGRVWMERDFSWTRSVQKMLETYEWVLHRGPKPDFVLTT